MLHATGLVIVGAGRMGRHRARLAAQHAAVERIAIVDIDPDRARLVADEVGATVVTDSAEELLADPSYGAAVISTPESAHVAPTLAALASGKHVLVEKPLATELADAEALVAAAQASSGTLHVGYSQRFRREFFIAKEAIRDGRIGRISSLNLRVYNSRAQAFAILKREPGITPVVDVLTYWVDVACWFNGDDEPVEVIARGSGSVFTEAGYPHIQDATWALLTFRSGTVANLGICYSLPADYPTLGQNPRVEVLGSDGVILMDGDQRSHVLHSAEGLPHPYVPGHKLHTAFLGTTSSGDWALDRMFGPIADETRTWLDFVAGGSDAGLARPDEALRCLRVTLAMEESSREGTVVRL